MDTTNAPAAVKPIRIDEDLHRRLKVAAAARAMSMQALAEKLLRPAIARLERRSR